MKIECGDLVELRAADKKLKKFKKSSFKNDYGIVVEIIPNKNDKHIKLKVFWQTSQKYSSFFLSRFKKVRIPK